MVFFGVMVCVIVLAASGTALYAMRRTEPGRLRFGARLMDVITFTVEVESTNPTRVREPPPPTEVAQAGEPGTEIP
jgi:hypothetical protein